MLKTINEVSLARDLVRCQSVTPKDDGAINVVAKNLKKLGFKCQFMEFKEKGTPQIKNLYAKIGKNCHISGGVGIGGVLEPLQANPVIIEDNCFIGARSEVAEGVIVGEGSVISMGVYLGASTKIIDRKTNKIIYGKVPPYSVVVSGTLANEDKNKPSLYCAVIVKTVDEKTRSKTSINDLLRD